MEETNELLERISQLERENLELKERINELHDFVENAALPLHWVNGSGIVIWSNQYELDILGYKKEEYIGRHISNFHADKEVIDDILFRLIKKETILNYPARLIAKSGKIVKVLINSNVFWKGGEFIHTRFFTRVVPDMKTIQFKG